MKKTAKTIIFLMATAACAWGYQGSQEPVNYLLWWLMFVLVLIG